MRVKRNPNWRIITCLLMLAFLVANQTNAQTYKVLHHFQGLTGNHPSSPLAQRPDGTLYGTTEGGGTDGSGVVYTLQTNGTSFAVLKNFVYSSDGAVPKAGLASYGTVLFGTTISTYDGSFGGSIFTIDTDGSDFTTLKRLSGNGREGGWPGQLVLSGQTLCGMSEVGGTAGWGTIFKINTDGSGFEVLHNFVVTNGAKPQGRLTQTSTALYGATYFGGQSNFGLLFKASTYDNCFTILKHFTGADGRYPAAGLVLQGAHLYGTTLRGGAHDGGTVFRINTDGTGFLVLKHFSFTNQEPTAPTAELLLSNGIIYGTSSKGGISNKGTLFQLKTDGTDFSVLKHFTGNDGATPLAALLLSGDTLYGTASEGGSFDQGVVFSFLVAPLPPLVLLNPTCSNMRFSFSFQTEVGRDYVVEHNTEVSSSNWQFHHSAIGDGSLMSCTVPITNAEPHFFRVRQL